MRLIKQFLITVLTIYTAFIVVACSNGGGNTADSLSGTAATGKGIEGIVYVTDANGTEVNIPTAADGGYSIQVPGMVAPFIVRVVPNGGGDTLYSYATKAGQTINVTPLTNLALFLASGSTDLEAIYNSWDGAGLTPSSILEAQKKINANLEAKMAALGIDAKSYDFMTTVFSTDGTGIDGVLDTISLAFDYTNGNFTISVDGSSFAFDDNIDISGFNFGGATTTGGGSASGSVTISGAGSGSILSGTTFEPPVGVITQGNHQILPNTTFYTITWVLPGAGAGDGTTLSYTETDQSGSVSYAINLSSGEHQPVFNFSNFSAFNFGGQIAGVSVDKATGTISFANVILTADGSNANPGDVALDGDLSAK